MAGIAIEVEQALRDAVIGDRFGPGDFAEHPLAEQAEAKLHQRIAPVAVRRAVA